MAQQAVVSMLNSVAPGVFSHVPESIPADKSRMVKTGSVQKMGRGRFLLAFAAGPGWKARNITLYASGNLQYFDPSDSTVLGSLSILNAQVKMLPSDGTHENLLEISTPSDGPLQIAFETAAQLQEWMIVLTLVAEGKASLTELGELLGIRLPQTLEISVDEDELRACLVASGYETSRLVEIFYQTRLGALVKHIRSEAQQDDEGVYAQTIGAAIAATRRIILKPFPESPSNPYNRTSITPAGELLIEFQRANCWTNLDEVGRELPQILTAQVPGQQPSTTPYLIDRCIRRNAADRSKHLASISETLGISVQLVEDATTLPGLAQALTSGNYTLDRYADVIYGDSGYLRNIARGLRELAGDTAAHPEFAAAFAGRFVSRRIVLRPAPDPSLVQSYNRVFFAPDSGDLVFEWTSFWTNLNSIGPLLLAASQQ